MTILGSGFTGASRVTFGGVPATVRVNGPNRITATPHPVLARSRLLTATTTGVFAGEKQERHSPGRGQGCQLTLARSLPDGSAHPLEGPVTLNPWATWCLRTGCHCETMQAPTEFDYLPAPSVTSVSTLVRLAAKPREREGQHGNNHFHGAGLDPLTIDWADFGNPRRGVLDEHESTCS